MGVPAIVFVLTALLPCLGRVALANCRREGEPTIGVLALALALGAFGWLVWLLAYVAEVAP